MIASLALSMAEMAAASWAWLSVYGPLLLIPSVLVGLSTAPTGWGIKAVLNFFSVLTHRDVAGTFQLPLGLQAVISPLQKRAGSDEAASDAGSPLIPPSSAEKPLAATTPPPFPPKGVTSLLLMVGLIMGLGSCAGLTAETGKKLGMGLLDCTVGALVDPSIKVLPAVSTVIRGGTVNWLDQLETLGIGFGVNEVMCAAKQVMASLAAPSTSFRASPAFIEESLAAQGRARAFIERHGMAPDKIKPPLPVSGPDPAPESIPAPPPV